MDAHFTSHDGGPSAGGCGGWCELEEAAVKTQSGDDVVTLGAVNEIVVADPAEDGVAGRTTPDRHACNLCGNAATVHAPFKLEKCVVRTFAKEIEVGLISRTICGSKNQVFSEIAGRLGPSLG